MPVWQSPDCRCSAQCERSISVSPLSCWANGSVSAVVPQQPSHAGLAVAIGQHRSTPVSSHNIPMSTLSAKSKTLPASVFYLFTRTLLQWKSQVQPVSERGEHPPSLSKTRYRHNWPVHQVSCWKSRFCTDVKPVALCNHVHTRPGFNYTLEGKTEGLSGFYFKVPFQGKLAAQAWIQILILGAKLLVWII